MKLELEVPPRSLAMRGQRVGWIELDRNRAASSGRLDGIGRNSCNSYLNWTHSTADAQMSVRVRVMIFFLDVPPRHQEWKRAQCYSSGPHSYLSLYASTHLEVSHTQTIGLFSFMIQLGGTMLL